MAARWLFLFAYTCSGVAGLIYQVAWTRLLALHMGHTTAAATTVVTAFMGGLAVGAFAGGRLAPRLTPRQSLFGYVSLECLVGIIAIALPFELAALEPVLAWSYRDGVPGLLFPAVRVVSCLIVIFVPAAALGATFPLAAHWFVREPTEIGRWGGALYAANSAGAAIGALAAGFFFIPWIGISGTTLVGVAAGGLAVVSVLVIARMAGLKARTTSEGTADLKARTTTTRVVRTFRSASGATDAGDRQRADAEPSKAAKKRSARQSRRSSDKDRASAPALPERPALGAIAVALSGFAALMFEIAWMRVFAMIVGPTTYAFSATVAAVIAGLAIGSAAGAWGAGRLRRPALWLTLTLAATAIATTWASSLAGGYLPLLVAQQVAASSGRVAAILMRDTVLVAALIVPAAFGFGATFPLALSLVASREQPAAGRVGAMYAVNTLGAVGGSLAAGFLAIPYFGLQGTLTLVSGVLVFDALLVAIWGTWGERREGSAGRRVAALVPAAAAIVLMTASPAWDRDLLASGVYKYASQVPPQLDLETALKAGTLLYYREGAAATVSVKRLTGAVSLSIDGKVDASSVGDMLTQKALAHLPLLLHPDPREVLIIGLGSGATLGSALVHPITRADVVEISPEVVEASEYFADVNLGALDNPRTNLIVGDGRSHLLLSSRTYDVIVSEPSNPWMAGVAALFTREFFQAARDRLAPGGIICQWAHTYDISDSDLRSIVATFSSVFPDGTIWMVGESDLLLVASTGPLDGRLASVEQAWRRPGVAADLGRVSAQEPFAFLSMFAGGPQELARYGAGAAVQTDDRMALEFSGPRALARLDVDNASQLRLLLDPDQAPAAVRRALAGARAAEWRNRAAMMAPADRFVTAYGDYVRALKLDATDTAALDGVVRAAVATHRENETLDFLKSLAATDPRATGIRIAISKLLAARGSFDEAIQEAERACEIEPVDPRALEQLASLLADIGDAARLEPVVQHLQQRQPERASSAYYAAAARFLRGQFAEAIRFAEQAVARDPQYAAAHNLLGAIHASVDNRDSARAAFAAALRLNHEDASVYTNLGLLELSSGNPAAARAYFIEALSLDPQSEAARRGLEQARPAASD